MSRFLSWVFYSGALEGATEKDLRQVLTVNAFSWIGVSVLVIFGVVNLLRGQSLVGMTELLSGLVLLVNTFAFRLNRSITLTARVLLAVNFLVLVLLIVTGGIARTGAFWVFSHLPAAFFLRSWKEGSVWVGSLVGVILALGIAAWQNMTILAYSGIEIRQLATSLFVTGVLMGIIEKSRSDFEERSASTEELSEMKTELLQVQSALHQSISAIVVVDETGKVSFSNSLWQEAVKAKGRDQVLGRSIYDFVEARAKDDLEKMIEQIKGGKEFTEEVVMQTVKQQPFIFWSQWKPLFRNDNKYEGFVIVGRDVTLQRLQAKQLEKNAKDLERTKSQLEEKVRRLERLNKVMVDREVELKELKKRVAGKEEDAADNKEDGV